MRQVSAGQGGWTAGDESGLPEICEDDRGWVRTTGDCAGRPGIGEDGRGLWGTAGRG